MTKDELLKTYKGREPLLDYPWRFEVDRLCAWAEPRSGTVKAFCFDLLMSLAYIDATPGIERFLERCPNTPLPFNAHLGFINLCAACYEGHGRWTFQKAAKPQSGAIGKLSSEIVLRLTANFNSDLSDVRSIGGTELADAILERKDGSLILAEVKSAPLVTYPLLIELVGISSEHTGVELTATQLKACYSGLYVHNRQVIPLGKSGDEMWPFRAAVDYVCSETNDSAMQQVVATWHEIREVYRNKDKSKRFYYLANASGNPPILAKERDRWPKGQTISDSKTSAGMDRTDDIKKGMYQTLKLGSVFHKHPEIKTAIVSNLPAYRHADEYVKPILSMLWGHDRDIETDFNIEFIQTSRMRRVVDYLITLDGDEPY